MSYICLMSCGLQSFLVLKVGPLTGSLHNSSFNSSIKDLWKFTPFFRSPQELQALRKFLIEHPIKEHNLALLATALISHFAYDPP